MLVVGIPQSWSQTSAVPWLLFSFPFSLHPILLLPCFYNCPQRLYLQASDTSAMTQAKIVSVIFGFCHQKERVLVHKSSFSFSQFTIAFGLWYFRSVCLCRGISTPHPRSFSLTEIHDYTQRAHSLQTQETGLIREHEKCL